MKGRSHQNLSCHWDILCGFAKKQEWIRDAFLEVRNKTVELLKKSTLSSIIRKEKRLAAQGK